MIVSPHQIPYRFFDHTSDLGLHVLGKDIDDLFRNSGLALMDVMADMSRIEPSTTISIKVEQNGYDLLLKEWLSELLFTATVEMFFYGAIEIHSMDESHVHATISGEKFDPQKHTILRELKSVTYHKLEVRQVKHKWQATFVIDI